MKYSLIILLFLNSFADAKKDCSSKFAKQELAVWTKDSPYLITEKGSVEDLFFSIKIGASIEDIRQFFQNRGVNAILKSSGSRDNKKTALHIAAHYGHIEVIKYLVEKRAEINPRDESGKTPLHWATLGNNPKAIKLLIDNQAEVNLKSEFGKTPIHIAAEKNYLDAAKALLASGKIDLTIRDAHGSFYGNTPYARVSGQKGFEEMAKLLKEHGGSL